MTKIRLVNLMHAHRVYSDGMQEMLGDFDTAAMKDPMGALPESIIEKYKQTVKKTITAFTEPTTREDAERIIRAEMKSMIKDILKGGFENGH